MLQLKSHSLAISERRILNPFAPRQAIDHVPVGTIHRVRGRSSRVVNLDGQRNAIAELSPLPLAGEAVHCVVDRRFVPCDLIPVAIALNTPAVCLSLTITTLSLNLKNIACITGEMDAGRIQSVKVLVSHVFSERDKPVFGHAKEELAKRGGLLKATRTHSKVICIEMSNGNNYVIEGSANLRSCNSIEQFVLVNDANLLTFHRTWIENYIASIGTGESKRKPRRKWHRH